MATASLRRSIVGVAILLALVAGACLPATVRPTPTPSPTPVPTPTPAPTPSPTPGPPTPTPAPTFLTYVVRPGDTLLSIARRHGTTGRSIAYWNRATYPSLDPDSPDYEPDDIRVGWTLVLIPGVEYVPSDDESPPASPTPQASLVIPPGPTPAASGASVVVSAGGRGGNAVALTFDLGGRVEPAVDIVAWLVEHDVPATIFPTGASATGTAAGREVLRIVAAHPDLLTTGNHTWDHPDVTTLGAPAIADQLARTEAAVVDVTGRSTRPFFRPPYGAHDSRSRAAVGTAGWDYTVLWDVDTIDWRPVEDGGPTAQDIVTKVLSRAQGGSIVLMHLGGWNTLDALPDVVAGLRERGLEPVTLHRLLGVEPG